jgi:hypothetical protein
MSGFNLSPIKDGVSYHTYRMTYKVKGYFGSEVQENVDEFLITYAK